MRSSVTCVSDRSEITLEDLRGPHAAGVLAALRAREPVAWIPVLRGWLVTTHALATAVMRDAATFTVDHHEFSTARVIGPSMLSLDGSEHLRHRRPFGHAFRSSQVAQRFGPRTSGLAAELVEAVRPAGHADLRAELARPLSAAVVATAIGLHEADASTVLRWYTAISGAVTDITAGSPPRPEAGAAMADLTAAVQAVLTQGDGSLLAAASPVLDNAEITSNAAVLMFGGIDTTEAMITNALLHVLGDPALSDAVRRDRRLLGPVIEESLRLQPAASVVDRYATADVMLGSSAVRRGELVRVSLTAANRDPDVFAHPDVFDPLRNNLDQQVAFARGPHSCLAMDLARQETRAALSAVLRRLPGVRLAGNTDVTGLVFRKPDALLVAWDPQG